MRWILTRKCFDIIIIAFDYIQLLAMPPEKYEVYAFCDLQTCDVACQFNLEP